MSCRGRSKGVGVMASMALLWAVGGAPAAWAIDDDPNTRDLKVISAWFAGEWDNDEQRWFEADFRQKWPAERQHRRVHVTHTRVDMPQLGHIVFFVEEYADNDPTLVIRRELQTFETEPAVGMIRSKSYLLRDVGRDGPDQDIARLVAALGSTNIVPRSGCDIVWRPEAGQYRGTVDKQTCVAERGGKTVRLDQELWLSADKYWRNEHSYSDKSGDLVEGSTDGEPYKMRRAYRFSCDVGFTVDYLRGPQPGDERFSGLSLHTQGGEVTVHRASTGTSYSIRLRDHEYPYYESRSDFLFLAVREVGKPFVGYSLHDRDARLIGLNLNWMHVYCEKNSG